MRIQTPAPKSVTWRHAVSGVLAPAALAVVSVFGAALGLAAAPAGATTVFSQAGGFNAVSCWSASDCVAVASNGLTASTSDAGAADGGDWGAQATISGQDLDAVSCPAANTCFAMGEASDTTDAFETTNGGANWAQLGGSGLTNGSVISMDCPSTSVCYATQSDSVLVTTDGGAAWTTVNEWLTTGTYSLIPEISCWSTTSCLMGGPDAGLQGSESGAYLFSTTNGGTTWNLLTAPSGLSTMTTLSCWGAGACEVGGNNGPSAVVASTADTGTSWNSAGVGGTSSILALNCDAQGACGGLGAGTLAVVVTGSAGGGFSVSGQAAGSIGGVVGGTGASCSGSTCALVGWSTGTPPHPVATSTAVTAPPPAAHGYWLVGSDGGIFTFGSAQFYGSTGSLHLQRPVVGIVPTADRGGYWLDASDGGVFSFGDTQFYGSIPGLGLHPAGSGLPNSLNAPIVGMVPSHDQGGYFMVASDGGVFAFGDAHFAGSCPGIGGCSGAAVAVMPDASGNGYWLVTATGHIYTFGDATYYGAPGPQSSPITSAVATPDGAGYYILDADGQVFAYGDANGTLGSVPAGSTGGFNPASAIFATSDNGGYWVADAMGDVYSFGDAPYDGGMGGTHLNGPIIAASGS
jgi:hypothetical protein